MTQKQIIKEKLSNGEWICGTWFMENYIPEFRSRINEIRKEGWAVEARPCSQHAHNSKTLQEWHLLGETSQETAPRNDLPPKNDIFSIPLQNRLFQVTNTYE